jgi:cell division transport system permease protein
MFLLNTSRILKFSIQSFYRNIWLSLVTVTVIVLTLLSLTSLIILNSAVNQSILTIKDKIDISVYFPADYSEDKANEIKDKIKNYNNVKTVEIITSEFALAKFKKTHEHDEIILTALEELGENPLGPSLTVKAINAKFYPEIINKLSADGIDEIAEEINYDDHQIIIEKLEDIGRKVSKAGLIISIIFAIISILVVFNTVRICIYTHKDEIGIMKLVGASNWFIRLPFLFEGIFYAILGTVIFWLIFYLLILILI